MWNKLIPREHDSAVSVALLVLRVAAGAFFVNHGWGKIQNPLHWMDGGGAAAPAVFQLLAAVSEFGGGIAWVLGLLTPLASAGIFCTMAVAVYTHLTRGGSFELAAIYLCISVGLVLAGPGRFSLDAWISKRWRKA